MKGKLGVFKNKSLNTFLKYSFKYKWAMFAVIIMSTIAQQWEQFQLG